MGDGITTAHDAILSYRQKIIFCRKFSQKYMLVLVLIFLIIIGKRILFQNALDVSKLVFHLSIIMLTLLSLVMHKTKDLATRLAPHLICLLSFFGHTRYLAFGGGNNSITPFMIND
jgi:hypothetical protein